MKYEGYLIVDHRASPGIAGSKLFGEGTVYEAATQFCNHCAVSVVMNPERTRARYTCPKCMIYLCDICTFHYHRNKVCRPWKQVVDDVKDGRPPLLARDVKG